MKDAMFDQPIRYGTLMPRPLAPRLSALYNLIRSASMAVDNNDRITAKAVLTNAEHVVLAMMERANR